MKLSEYLEHQGRGARSKLAAAIGAHRPDLSDWINGSRVVPAHRCLAIERATGGVVTRRDLRPQDWMKFWPELEVAAEA